MMSECLESLDKFQRVKLNDIPTFKEKKKVSLFVCFCFVFETHQWFC